jgi:TRAP-type mannitol/chloroaromatic compound transport system permease small subunit
MPNNHLVSAILVTLFCMPITGIIAIVKSSQVSGLWAQGQYAEAQASADSAKKWVKWSIIIWVGLVVLSGVLAVIAGLSAPDSSAAMLAAMM